MCSQANDFLLCTDLVNANNLVCDTINKEFRVTLQSGDKLNYLNFRIIQRKCDVSLDQTDHILDLLSLLFDKSLSTTKVHTPKGTDKHFSFKLAKDIPASPSELKGLAKVYGGSFLSLYGTAQHVSSAS